MIKYEESLDKALITIEKDALSDTNFISAYATGRLQGMCEAAFHSGNAELFNKVDAVRDRVNDIQNEALKESADHTC